MEYHHLVMLTIHLLIASIVLIIGYLVKFNEDNKDYQYSTWIICSLFPLINIAFLHFLFMNDKFEKIDKDRVRKLQNIVYFLPLLSLGLLYFV